MTPLQRVNLGIGKVPPWLIYAIAVVPPAWLLWLGLTGGLGAEPIKELEQQIGKLALQTFVLSLAIRPLREWVGINLLKLRRAFGLVTFFYVFLHLLVWLVLDVGILSEIWADILKRPYVTVGMSAFVLMIPLALTSNNASLRKMGPKSWKRLHRLAYPAILLGAVHYIMQAKGFQIEPLIYLGIIMVLLAARIRVPRKAALA